MLWCTCIPLPLSPKIGFGMNVTVLPCRAPRSYRCTCTTVQRVGHLHQRQKAQIDLRLPRRRHLVVVLLHPQPHPLHRADHLRADVLLAVGRRHRKVPFLVARLVPQVRVLLAPRVPLPFGGIQEVEPLVLVLPVADVVENEELRLRAEVGHVADARRLQVRLRLARDVARVARVVLLGDRVDDVADQRQRRLLA